MNRPIKQVLIVGGGTAGWLCAGILARQLGGEGPDTVQITLVESPDIPILGVGEGTWPTMRNTLRQLGVDEGAFMRECDATFKQGSEFVNWSEPPVNGSKQSYYHPLSAVFHSAYEFNLAPYWLAGDAGANVTYDKAVASQTHICRLGLAPKKITTPAYEALQNYSYHLNANKFAAFLTRHCVEKLGVRHVVANVKQVLQDEQGFLTAVTTDHGNEARLDADFFVDCSGARAVLLEGALAIRWHGLDNTILNDTALAMQVPYEHDDCAIATHTIATAHEAGWSWDIGLHNRRGVGYVYSSAHSSDDRAEQVLRDYIGPMAAALEVRKLKLKLGYRERFWEKNCVALGMSAAFIEPLEASAIFLVEAGAHMLAEQFPCSRAAMPYVAAQYNQTFRLRWDKTVDFVKLHYCLSKRRDTDYWRDNCESATIPPSLQAKLNHWQHHLPSKHDFDYAFEPFVLDSYLFVLYGMGFRTNIADRGVAATRRAEARRRFADIAKQSHMLARELPSQRELVDKVYQYGMPSL